MATRPVLRIFISSTAIDLRDYRDKVRDAVLRLENLPIAMETFSAKGGEPATECMRLAAEADAVVCIVAHRYGYVPPKDLGGDGERSITWLEVEAAKLAGKPVYAFLVDPKAQWTEVKEQDRLLTEPDKEQEILKAIRKLQEFKRYIESGHVRGSFTSPEDLDAKVTATLTQLAPQVGHSTARIWKPLFCHALQPAPHFRGRETQLRELKEWLQSPVTPDRVISVVAMGGTGKTALVDKALHDATLSDRAGVFVWSFYEDPHVDAFLRAAYLYFTDDKDAPTGGMLERLQLALSGDAPHVLVLDGLERVQSEGGGPHPRGELEDLQLKRFVKALAGGIGAARALVTSRFPLADLQDWIGRGHRAIVLDDLDRPIALEVLRGWGVKGDEAALAKLIEPLNASGLYHALSVAVMGSYVGNFAAGDPRRFSLADAKEDDRKGAKLGRILEQYAKALTAVERDLLARLSLFPRGVKVEILAWISESGSDVAGALVGLKDLQLLRHLERLKALGLVFHYETDGQVVYSAHPFLREFFRGLLVTKAESVHESVRAKLAPSLEARPKASPRESAILDQYELLVEQTLLAGRVKEAFDLYWFGLGNYANLGRASGESARGLRVVEGFLPQDNFTLIKPHLELGDQSDLVNELGGFAEAFGDLSRARCAFAYARQLDANSSDAVRESADWCNLAEAELYAGQHSKALHYADRAVSLATEAKHDRYAKFSIAYRATAYSALGNVAAATTDFAQAAKLEGSPLVSFRGIREAEHKALVGDRIGAITQTQANRHLTTRVGFNADLCRSDALLVWLLLPDDPTQAAQHLQDARAFADRSGDVELQLRCFHSAVELQRHLGDHSQSIAEAEAGLLLADTCGFGKFSIDLRLSLAETLLAAGDAKRALQNSREALDRSEHPDCQYAWGKADGLHWCGIAHQRLGERELARLRLTAALEIREKLGHGRIEETRRALARL